MSGLNRLFQTNLLRMSAMAISSDALDGSVALVTGASLGIGEATVEALADEGASVALAALSSDRLLAGTPSLVVLAERCRHPCALSL